MKRALVLLVSIMALTNSSAELFTIAERLAQFSEPVRARLAPTFTEAGVAYPPAQLTFIATKEDRVLQMYATGADGRFHFIRAYPILAASGALGPKLREGDRQVPEGIYRVRELNPNSLFHLSLWLDYPNDFDLARAAEDGRSEPGSEIMIHGDTRSRGCLAMGDEAAEDLFVLAASVGIENVTVILTPVDFRSTPNFAPPDGNPSWTGELYRIIASKLEAYSAPSLPR